MFRVVLVGCELGLTIIETLQPIVLQRQMLIAIPYERLYRLRLVQVLSQLKHILGEQQITVYEHMAYVLFELAVLLLYKIRQSVMELN